MTTMTSFTLANVTICKVSNTCHEYTLQKIKYKALAPPMNKRTFRIVRQKLQKAINFKLKATTRKLFFLENRFVLFYCLIV